MDLHVIFMFVIAPLLIGWCLDLLLGDPEGIPHPIIFFGKWIAWWEKHLNQGTHRSSREPSQPFAASLWFSSPHGC